MGTPDAAKRRQLTEVASLAGEVGAANMRQERAVAERNKAMLKAQEEGASYAELGEAAALSRVAVSKSLAAARLAGQ